MLSILVVRLIKRLSQDELAKRSGVSNQVISRIEKGKSKPKLATLEKIADALGVTVEYLLEYEKYLRDFKKDKEGE